MRIDSNIIMALDAFAKQHKLTKKQLAEHFGVSGATMTKWHRVGAGITNLRWNSQVFDALKPYLPKERIYVDDAGVERYSSQIQKQSKYFFEAKYVPVKVPVFTLDSISGYDDTLESIAQYAIGVSTEMLEYRPKGPQLTSSVFALRIENASAWTFPPAKMVIAFVSAGERPLDVGLVICRPVNGKAFMGEYKRDGANFTITDIATAKSITGAVAQAKQLISWIYPVLYMEVVTF